MSGAGNWSSGDPTGQSATDEAEIIANGEATTAAMVVADRSVGAGGGDAIRCGGDRLFGAAADAIHSLKSPWRGKLVLAPAYNEVRAGKD
jgi:hypothetical protein